MKTILAIVETPGGSAEKYDYDPENKWFKLSKIMPSIMDNVVSSLQKNI